MHLGVSPPALRGLVPDLPGDLERIVMRTLEKNPDARFQSMKELEDALRGRGAIPTLVSPEEAAPTLVTASTLQLEEPPATRVPRRTTLAGAAAEVQRGARRWRVAAWCRSWPRRRSRR